MISEPGGIQYKEGKHEHKMTWYGHAALGLETGGHHVLVDPFLSDNPAASISPDRVPAEFILISHGHGDHVGDAGSNR